MFLLRFNLNLFFSSLNPLPCILPCDPSLVYDSSFNIWQLLSFTTPPPFPFLKIKHTHFAQPFSMQFTSEPLYHLCRLSLHPFFSFSTFFLKCSTQNWVQYLSCSLTSSKQRGVIISHILDTILLLVQPKIAFPFFWDSIKLLTYVQIIPQILLSSATA